MWIALNEQSVTAINLRKHQLQFSPRPVRTMSSLLAHRRRRWSLIGLLQFSTTRVIALHTGSSAAAVAAAVVVPRPRIAVIGGGASGIFSAIQAASHGNHVDVVVLEAGPKTLGKVKISGGGRCNVLHDTTKPTADILESYPRGRKELQGLYNKHFTPQHAREWFTKRGVQLKTEEDGRMFPTTDSSQTIIDTLLQAANDAGVDIRRQQKVFGITRDDSSGKFAVTLKESKEYFDAIVLATGSAAIGHDFARNFGHTIVDPVPSLFTLNTKHLVQPGGMLHGLSGVSVPLARVTFQSNMGNKKQSLIQEGPLLITHHGISGPATLRLSAFAARAFHHVNYRGDVVVHWAPELGSAEDIADMLWQCKTTSPKRAVSTSCPLMLDGQSSSSTSSAIPRRLWAAMVAECGFDKENNWSEAPKKKINALARMVSDCILEVTGKSVFKEEFVTAGGVSLKEIDMKRMASKKCPGLFLCGEVIDVDGVTGGFNFMNCWSTGYTAGNGAADYTMGN
jgi:predicted Rossmann fold flavoprotein